MPKIEIGDILNELNVADPGKVTDDEILAVDGVGPATLEKVRNARVIAKKHLTITKGNTAYNASPGDVIPEGYDRVYYVRKGLAEWR